LTGAIRRRLFKAEASMADDVTTRQLRFPQQPVPTLWGKQSPRPSCLSEDFRSTPASFQFPATCLCAAGFEEIRGFP
jgi:hypothetical protein